MVLRPDGLIFSTYHRVKYLLYSNHMATTNLTPMGTTILSWKTPEFPAYKRGRLWFIIAIIAALALLVQAFLTTNYIFMIVILMFAIIIALTTIRSPELVEVCITETGILHHKNFVPYRDVERFWIVYQPPVVQNLYLDLKGGIRSRLTIDLQKQNPIELREALLEHVSEDIDRTDEPITDFIGRLLKL